MTCESCDDRGATPTPRQPRKNGPPGGVPSDHTHMKLLGFRRGCAASATATPATGQGGRLALATTRARARPKRQHPCVPPLATPWNPTGPVTLSPVVG
ncbi:hypothetical protein IV77_GL000355 [Olsenella uli DSM 7084]|nr:hypothetical protein IV77_GL000355 [Olsenella uli DSM 7084]